uniref:hypothetical protein n=1 Tax=Streptomyces sp. WELS2 TaxID=2749435 RepID=UPI0015F10BE4
MRIGACVTGSSQSSDQAQGLAAIGGNVTAGWRGWWTWSPGNGTWNLQIPRNVIGVDSTVVVTASEIDGNGNRFVGDAAFTGCGPRAGVTAGQRQQGRPERAGGPVAPAIPAPNFSSNAFTNSASWIR